MRTGNAEPTCDWGANGYRLPTEAEWEKAARGGIDGKRFPWGTDTINHSNANYYASSTSATYDTTGFTVFTYHPTYQTGIEPFTASVGSFAGNGFELFDVSGNVWEWCWDWYEASYYSNAAFDPKGPSIGIYRSVRGGSYITAPWGQRCAYRLGNRLPINGSNNRGFRIACTMTYPASAISATVVDTREPEIELEQPSGTALVDGSATTTWQALPTGGTAVAAPYVIRNVGVANLLNLGLTKSGTHAADFLLGSLSTTTLAPGESTAFTVTFSPDAGASGTRTATLQVASNDVDENPFDIALSGTAYSTTLDADSDGMNDWAEFKLSALGFNWQTPNTALVSTYYDNAAAAGLFTTTQVQDLNVGTPLIHRHPTTGVFTLTLGVEKSTTLLPGSFTSFPMMGPGTSTVINGQGKLEFQFTVPDNAAFFRLKSQPTP